MDIINKRDARFQYAKKPTKIHKDMPVTTRKIGDKWRVVEARSRRIATNDKGTAVDGGGHDTKEEAEKQARAINASE